MDTEHTEETTLNPAEIEQTDQDLRVLSAFSNLVSEKGAIFALSGGYAVEAHCGGKITRPHGDLDGYIFNLEEEGTRDLITEAKTKLSRLTGKSWQREVTSDPKNIEIKEIGSDGNLLWRGRLEIYVLNTKPHIVQRILIDSKGTEYAFNVQDVNVEVAHKLMAFTHTSDDMRQTKPTDLVDLKRLLEHSDFDMEKTIEYGSEYYVEFEDMNEEEGKEQVKKDWQEVQTLLNS